jgi:acyl-CoA thioester hydrolase
MSDKELIEVARYRVIFADCDPMRIMYYAGYFRLFEIGRAELFRHLGHPFPEYIARGLYLGVIEATCRYRRPARYDDLLTIRAGVAEVGRARLEIAYEVLRGDELLVSGSTVHAVIDEDGRPQRIPAEFREAALSGRRTSGD